MSDQVYNYITKRYNKRGGAAYKKWLTQGAYDAPTIPSPPPIPSPFRFTPPSPVLPIVYPIPSPSPVLPIVYPIPSPSPFIPIPSPQPDVRGPLSNIPDEVLKSMLIDLPYHDILDKCTTNKQFARICSNRIFWADKAKQDFNVPTQTFHQKQGQPAKIYHDYLVEHEITKFLTEVFNYGMFLRGWSGHGPYPQQLNPPTDMSIKLSKYHNVIKTYENSSKSSKEIIDKILIVRPQVQSQGTVEFIHAPSIIRIFDYEHGPEGFGRSVENIYGYLMSDLFTRMYPLTESTSLRGSRLNSSDILISTALDSLNKYGKTIGNFKLSDFAELLQEEVPPAPPNVPIRGNTRTDLPIMY